MLTGFHIVSADGDGRVVVLDSLTHVDARVGSRDVIVAGSFGIAVRAFRHGEAHHQDRTDRDLPVTTMLVGVVLSGQPLVVRNGAAGRRSARFAASRSPYSVTCTAFRCAFISTARPAA